MRTNLDRMASLVGTLSRNRESVLAALDEFEAQTDSSDPEEQLNKLGQAVREFIQVTAFANEWYIVMLVTFAETYLHDLLVDAAGIDPSLMEDSKQSVAYSDVTAFTSIGALATEMRTRWARNFLEKAGPRTWIDRFERMGARGFPRDLADQLEELWGIRHVVVHSAGRVTKDFVDRYLGRKLKKGDSIPLDKTEVLGFLKNILAFVGPIDKFFITRFGKALQ
jgi:hypothetical protein